MTNNHQAKPQGAASEDPRPLILVIDDDDAFRETAETLLERQGYAVMTADRGDVALEAMEEELPALILLDVFMPGMDGFEFLRALRSSEVHVPVLVTSGVMRGDHDPMLSAAMALGADGVLRKPFRIEELQRLIEQIAPGIAAAARKHG